MKLTIRLIVAFLLFSAVTNAQNAFQGYMDNFVAKTGAIPTIDKATSSLSFLRFPKDRPMELTGGTPQQKALNFVTQNSGLFPSKSTSDVYQVKETKKDKYGMQHVVLQQYVSGVPVFDGILKFHFNKSDDLSSMNGNVIKVNKLNTIPTISKEVASALALKMVESQKSQGVGSTINPPLLFPLKVNKNTLYVFQKGLAEGYEGQKHLVYEVEVRNDADVREFLYIDAHTKELVEQFTGTHAIDRKLYEISVTPANLKWQESNGIPSPQFTALDVWQKSEIETADFTYNLMKNAFGHTSYDGADATMITINNNPSISCPNANWNGVTANYCTGVAADDVVAHEWGHAYTEYTSGLVYAWQSGALNEAYSDIWGETVDLLDNYFDTGEGTALRPAAGGDCPLVATTTRWKMGEQTIGFGGSLRDMYNPNCNGNPGRVLDPVYYCATGAPSNSNDQGGVHHNSGVLNHSYALLVDGGTYNGQTINGIGLTKAAHIYWYAQANFMSKTTDFAAQADILEASALALIGIDLPTLSTGITNLGLSGQIITNTDVDELKKVLLAVELRAENNCGYTKLLLPLPAICQGGTAPNAMFYYDFEAGLGDWTVSNTGVTGTWFPRNWVVNSAAPGSHPGKVMYAVDFNGGDCVTDNEHGLMSLTSPVMAIDAGAATPLSLAFDHYVSIESGWDGGNIRYKIGAGAWTLVPSVAFIANGYNSTLNESGNPLKGEVAFSGGDGGSAGGSWGQSRINLTSLGLDPGESIQLRWDLGSDECGGVDGWYIDDVRIYSCSLPTVQFATTSTIVNEAEAVTAGPAPADCLPYVEKLVSVKINKAPSAPVTVTFNTPTGTATLGSTADYTVTPNAVILQAGTLSGDVVVRVYNDAYVEGTETAVLSYSISGGDGLPETINQTHTITIQDNDVEPGVSTVDVLNANFNDKLLPTGWISDFSVVWGSNPNTIYLDPVVSGQPFLLANSGLYSGGLKTWSIETSPFSTVGMKSINLSFLEVFRVLDNSDPSNLYAETAMVEAWDGTAWQTIFTESEATGTSGSYGASITRSIPILEAYSNAAMKLRFKYTANSDQYWALDNIKVTAGIPIGISNVVTAVPDEQYLGPKASAYFYDPTTNNLIAKIENLTTHDYGCTTVQIDRAGTGSDNWVAPYTITKKTFKVTPSNPNPTGEYNITLYFKDTELAGYKNAITSMGKSENGITIGNASVGSFAEVQVSAAFNFDWAYTAKFTSGFSGFGLSNAPPVGALPVTLAKFEGKHSTEGNLLNWTTTSEANSEYFAVERAADVKNFVEIGKVSGKGNSATTNNYIFSDTKYTKGLNYYRLNMVDKDGSHAYSRIIGIDALNLRELKFFPNPVQSLLHIELPDAETNLVSVKIINVSGQVVMEKEKIKLVKGIVTQDVSKLDTGIYQVVISDDNASYHFSVVKL